MKKRLNLIFIIIIITILFSSGCINTNNNANDENNKNLNQNRIYYEYKIIISNITNNYEIIIPFPINEYGNFSIEVFNKIMISKGEATYEIIDNKNESSLKIMGINTVELTSKYEDIIEENDINFCYYLSMTNLTEKWEGAWKIGQSKFFSNTDNIHLELSFDASLSTIKEGGYAKQMSFRLDEDINLGWQNITIKYEEGIL
jgi:hypothetical protein